MSESLPVSTSPVAIAIVVVGASGDLAKRKTFPCLFQLYRQIKSSSSSLSSSKRDFIIYGFGRTYFSHEDFRQSIGQFLVVESSNNDDDDISKNLIKRRSPNDIYFKQTKKQMNQTKTTMNEQNDDDDDVKEFLSMCFYQQGRGYDDTDAFVSMRQSIRCRLPKTKQDINYLVYMATPPNLFVMATTSIARTFYSPRGFLRVLYEKPFGSDLESYQQLSTGLLNLLEERQIYRIDHYLGKKMVCEIPRLRFANSRIKSLWNRNHISQVIIFLKETIGTEGRGGYFDQYGIIRDVMQNHLLQIMCLVAMEEPSSALSRSSSFSSYTSCTSSWKQEEMDVLRDAKCALLKNVSSPTLEDCVVGQYEGYKTEPMVQENSKTPTFAAIRLFVHNERWRGVPFILWAGKALDEKCVGVDLILRNDESVSIAGREYVQEMEHGLTNVSSGRITIGIQPQPYVSLSGSTSKTAKQELTIWSKTYHGPHPKQMDDSYTKLIGDALQGRSSSFVRDDELKLSWKIFTPLLHELEHIEPYSYARGSKGPMQAQKILALKSRNESVPHSRL